MTDLEWVKLLLPLVGQSLMLAVTYRLAIRQFRMSKASGFLERFMSPDVTKARLTVDRLCESPVDEMVKALRDGGDETQEDKLSQVRIFANFFQELGLAYSHRLVDRAYTEEIFDHLTKYYWDRLQPWVEAYRKERGDRSLYSKWHDLAVDFKHKESSKARKSV
jgi:hypothetical protein